MFGIKPFEYCVKDVELRQIWIELAEELNLHPALAYMRGDHLDFEITDETIGNPEFWLMARQIEAIAKNFDYSVEMGYLPPFKLFDFEIMSPEARKELEVEAEAFFNENPFGAH